MKKILGLVVACVAATFGLLSCSGGSDDANSTPGVMTMKQFQSGSKQFYFRGASVFIIAPQGGPVNGGSNTDTVSDRGGVFSHAGGVLDVSLKYEITSSTEDGVPQTAQLQVSFLDQTVDDLNDNEALLSDLGVANGDALVQSPIVFNIDYSTGMASCALQAQQGGNQEDGNAGGDGDGGVADVERVLNILIQNSSF